MLWKRFFANFFIFGVFFSSSLFADTELPTYGQVPDATFIEQSGKEMSLADLKGHVWIADFILTRCQGICPMLSGRMATFQEKLEGSNVKLVSFSVDPEYDTPKVLSEYAARFHAQQGKWFFLTGRKSDMWKFITEGFSLGVAKASEEDLKQGAEPVMHSGRFVLVDEDAQIRGYYDSSEPQKMEQLMKDALQLAL